MKFKCPTCRAKYGRFLHMDSGLCRDPWHIPVWDRPKGTCSIFDHHGYSNPDHLHPKFSTCHHWSQRETPP